MRFGYFNEKTREYVITDPKTPVKWINYIGTRQFGGFVDHTGGALICSDDPALNRITKYIQQMPSSDFKGETLYIRLQRGDDYIIYSPFFVPVLKELDFYECRVGLGYTRIISKFIGIRTEVTIFVPEKAKCEIRDIKIKNESKEEIQVDLIPVVEYTHPDALKQFTNADWVPQTMQSKVIKDKDGFTVLTQYPFMLRDNRINYFTSNYPVSSFETDRKIFLGGNEYGSFQHPLSLFQKSLSNSEALRGDNIAAMLHELGILSPDQEKRIITQLGQTSTLSEVEKQIVEFRNHSAVDRELQRLSKFWDAYLGSFRVDTPDKNLDMMINLFNARQCFITFTWSRYLSYYQLGLGARGIGIRDSSQDILAVISSIPSEAKDFIRLLFSFQKIDGSAMHQFNPISLIGSCGDSEEMEDRFHFYSDDHLWLILAVAAYIKETGDLDFLNEEIPFYEKDKNEKPIEKADVLTHIERAMSFTRNNIGKHGLPLLGFADWNDTVNLPKGAESLFTANLFGVALKEFMPIVEKIPKPELSGRFKEMYNEMKEKVESTGWGGEWYYRFFDHEGNPIGTAENRYTRIYLNGQTWPVISGFASDKRARKAMQSVYENLYTENGIKISAPPFNGYNSVYGGITTFPPGVKENGGIFVHPNPWAMIAETILGNGDRAYKYYCATNPMNRNECIEIYECEPYVYPQNIISDTHPQYGLARNSWLTGGAAWHYIAATQYILGIRPEIGGLRIDPCIPSDWSGFKAIREFRGKTYHIDVHNPQHVCKGINKVTVNGKTQKENLLISNDMMELNIVHVWLGH